MERTELTNKTVEELNQMKEELEVKLISAKEDLDAKINAKKIVEDKIKSTIQVYVKQFSDKVLIKNLDLNKAHRWSGEANDSEWEIVTSLNVERQDRYDDSIELEVYENCIKTSLYSCGTFKREENPSYVELIITIAELFKNEFNFIETCKIEVDMNVLEEYYTSLHNRYDVEGQIELINRRISELETIAKRNALKQTLVAGKCYIYDNNKEGWRNEKRYYFIDKVTDKTVVMTEAMFDGWWKEGYTKYGTHHFKLDDDVLVEMMRDEGKVVDNFDEQINKAKEEYERRIAKKENN